MYYLDSSSHTIKPLPKEQWKAVGKAKPGWTTVTSTGSIQLPGIASSFRVPASDKIEFVFKGTNPETVKLFVCLQDMKKGWRQFEVVQIKNHGRTSTQERLDGMPIEIVKYGDSSYKLTSQRLAPGEYAINGTGGVFSFGVQ
jgi:hypothetical protein